MMGPEQPLPLPPDFHDADEYVKSLLHFVTASELLQTLCGGVHILDFFTREPDLYSQILPEKWRAWFKLADVHDILDLLIRKDLQQFEKGCLRNSRRCDGEEESWRGGQLPPQDFLDYIRHIRRHCLNRCFRPNASQKHGQYEEQTIARHVAVGMKTKKIHEVQHFARYVDELTADIASQRGEEISYLVDFGSGQNYLGRALASKPYNKHVIAVESKPHNIDGAKNMDVLARLTVRPKIMRNKKLFRAEQHIRGENNGSETSKSLLRPPAKPSALENAASCPSEPAAVLEMREGLGSIQYIEKLIEDGDLSSVIARVVNNAPSSQHGVEAVTSSVVRSAHGPYTEPRLANPVTEPSFMTISLHSCGNLLHHGLRSLVMNQSVTAVCMVGCCYNLVTERLGPPTYKLPTLRPRHPRLEETSNMYDSNGFPMSEHLAQFPLPDGKGKGIRLNITARMMAVQAAQNWGKEDSEMFFKRHFYRALLQRIFLDRRVVEPPVAEDDIVGGSSSDGGTQPIIIGSLNKACYVDFVSYVRGAVKKLSGEAQRGQFIVERMKSLTDQDIKAYEDLYAERKKELSVVWSMMAFSAGVIESLIVVDRWQWLKEQPDVRHSWVEPIFDYRISPRNLVIVGIKNRCQKSSVTQGFLSLQELEEH